MSWIQIIAVSLSVIFHTTLAYAVLHEDVIPTNLVLDKGTGNDTIFVEQGIAIEGLAKLGNDMETIQATDAVPLADTPPPPPITAQPVEELQNVIASDASNVEDNFVKTEQPPPQDAPPPPPQAVAAAEPPREVVVAQEQSSGKQRLGNRNSSQRAKYLRELRTFIERSKFNPRTHSSGTVWLEFTIGPAGELLSRTVKKSSGSKILDKAAITTLDRAAPFPVMPKDISDKPMIVSVPFKFVTR